MAFAFLEFSQQREDMKTHLIMTEMGRVTITLKRTIQSSP